MLTSRIIPCLDVRGNRVVKGVQFQGLRDVGAPHELAEMYEQQGADEIVVLDVAATVKEQQTQLETVTSVREKLSIPLTVGGGIRSIDDMQRLTDAGADRISINTAAVGNPRFVSNAASRFGSQCVVVAIDGQDDHAEFVGLLDFNVVNVDARSSDRVGDGGDLARLAGCDDAVSGYGRLRSL